MGDGPKLTKKQKKFIAILKDRVLSFFMYFVIIKSRKTMIIYSKKTYKEVGW